MKTGIKNRKVFTETMNLPVSGIIIMKAVNSRCGEDYVEIPIMAYGGSIMRMAMSAWRERSIMENAKENGIFILKMVS
jgi:uncharacterized membrane protein YhhN